MSAEAAEVIPAAPEVRPRLATLREAVAGGCTECGACVAQCAFLTHYGTPKALADGYDPGDPKQLLLPFECSLCSLCTAVCPEGVDPQALFLEMRREAVDRGAAPLPEHRGLLSYEKAGTSRLLTWYALPRGCDTVFFPGCALPGTRPRRTREVFSQLRVAIPNLGLVLDCCTKPSHDLGREAHFSAVFGELVGYLRSKGVRRILVACPNCWKVFREHAPELAVETVYETLAGKLPAAVAAGGGPAVTIHDPCVMRFAEPAAQAVRRLAGEAGLAVEEMRHSRERTLCCGEGGCVGALAPAFAGSWGEKRAAEAVGRPVVTYCAGCAKHLSGRVRVAHVLDIVADPESALAGRAPVSRGLATYWNRFRLKVRLVREIPAAVTRERSLAPQGALGGWLKPLLILAVLAAAIAGVRATGLQETLEQEHLRALIAGFGPWAPAFYMLLYTVAPALFLPGLPITIVGGVLFGPFWGVVYTITSATAGACVAFLVSRYVARGWVERRLVGSRWQKLDQEVARQGWKVVAFTRLVPLFPFNLLNYALGLTKIGFVPYALTTFFAMLPACVAFIVFSSSLLDLLGGRVSPAFLAGVALVAAVSCLPLALRRMAARRAREVEGPRREWSLGRSLRIKAAVLAGLAILAGAGYGLTRRIFWALNAHLYTLEFHLLFLAGRLRDGNEALFVEYLVSLSPGRLLPALAGANLLGAFRFPASRLDLAAAAVAARGWAEGLAAGTAGLLVAALAAYAAGRFLFGDLRPHLRRRKGLDPTAPPRVWAAWTAALLLAFPALPAILGPAAAGAARVPPARAAAALAAGSLARTLLSTLL